MQKRMKVGGNKITFLPKNKSQKIFQDFENTGLP